MVVERHRLYSERRSQPAHREPFHAVLVENLDRSVEDRFTGEGLPLHVLTTYSISLRCKSMRDLKERRCRPEGAGRRPGTKEGDAARAVVVAALRDAGLDPFEQRVEGC